MRIWARMIRNNHLIKDMTVERDDDTRTHRVFAAIDEICHEWDLARPVWLDSNVAEFKKHAKTRFYQDSFVEEIPFDYLEIRVLEE